VTQVLNKLFRGVEILMAVFLGVMILLLFLNVVLRYVFSTGFAWSEEIARLCFIYLVYLGVIGAFRDNRHLGVDTFLNKFPEAGKKVVYFVIQGIIIWMMILLAKGSLDLAAQQLHDRWAVTHYPRFLVSGVGIVTGVAIILIALANLYRLIIKRETVADLLRIVESPEDSDVEAALD
jgi:TRAP-type C4-dicarboxylate transport system permease small subunit